VTAWRDRTVPRSLAGKRIALIADDTGWRNTTAFDLGVQALGGICVQAPIRFNTHETTADLAGYLAKQRSRLCPNQERIARGLESRRRCARRQHLSIMGRGLDLDAHSGDAGRSGKMARLPST